MILYSEKGSIRTIFRYWLFWWRMRYSLIKVTNGHERKPMKMIHLMKFILQWDGFSSQTLSLSRWLIWSAIHHVERYSLFPTSTVIYQSLIVLHSTFLWSKKNKRYSCRLIRVGHLLFEVIHQKMLFVQLPKFNCDRSIHSLENDC